MKYLQTDFSSDLNELINTTEHSFYEHSKLLLSEYADLCVKRDRKLTIEVEKYGKDPFMPGYVSIISVIIKREKDKIKIVGPIWKCQRTFFGIQLSKNLPGSKVSGELITLQDTGNVFKEFIEDNLK
ncbi:hypothetical protein [Neobacillus sp.]|uniref:hypothetical protein n=1 Tax=Neobacillus sp. TaxID=2675273 RepID=UPI0028A09C83|nr:hypothetical protein [Neobacillus sp.]